MAQRIVLVDGSSMFFRAYFAIPGNLATRSGLHTNAIFGFTTMLRKMLAGRTPDYAAVVFDHRGGSFRQAQYSDYKSQRPGMEDDLFEQLPWIDRVVEAFRFAMLRIPGFEADDVIATLATRARAAGIEVVIVSSDKDFCQLISEGTRMVDAIRDVTFDVELVRKKYGIRPEQFVDYQALVGDKIDNIPGVPGIGPKGAVTMLTTYGTLANLLEHAGEVSGKNGQLLAEHRESALLSQSLATLQCDVKLPLSLDDLRYTAPDQAGLNALYSELELYSLLAGDAKTEQALRESAPSAVRLISDPTELALALQGTSFSLCLLYDPPLATGAWAGMAAVSEGASLYSALPPTAWKSFLEDPTRLKVVHDLRPLLVLARRHGIEPRGIAGFTRAASFLVEPTRNIPHELETVAREYLQCIVRPLKSLLGSGQKQLLPCQVPIEEAADYAAHVAEVVGRLWTVLSEKLEESGQVDNYRNVELPLAGVLADMERVGVRVDPEDMAAMGVDFRERLAAIEGRIHELAGRSFNIGSPKQLGEVLFDELKLPVVKRTKTGYSTDAEVLERLAPKAPIAHELLEHRRLAKLINTYTDVLSHSINPVTGRVHANLQQTSSTTGRLISTDPDLQRTPVKTAEGTRIRQAFIADPGKRLISADWSQIELRVLAHFSDDPGLVEAFRDNLDVHRRTASQLFEVEVDEVTRPQREVAKTINFATIYGQGATALAQILGISRTQAQGYIASYFEAYVGVRSWLDRTVARAYEDGYVTTLLGRRRYLSELFSKNATDRQTGERMAANTPIQGSGADLCKLAMLKITDELTVQGLKTRLLMQIHDELVLEAPADEVESASEIVRRHMQSVVPLKVPLVVNLGVGANWDEAHR